MSMRNVPPGRVVNPFGSDGGSIWKMECGIASFNFRQLRQLICTKPTLGRICPLPTRACHEKLPAQSTSFSIPAAFAWAADTGRPVAAAFSRALNQRSRSLWNKRVVPPVVKQGRDPNSLVMVVWVFAFCAKAKMGLTVDSLPNFFSYLSGVLYYKLERNVFWLDL